MRCVYKKIPSRSPSSESVMAITEEVVVFKVRQETFLNTRSIVLQSVEVTEIGLKLRGSAPLPFLGSYTFASFHDLVLVDLVTTAPSRSLRAQVYCIGTVIGYVKKIHYKCFERL